MNKAHEELIERLKNSPFNLMNRSLPPGLEEAIDKAVADHTTKCLNEQKVKK